MKFENLFKRKLFMCKKYINNLFIIFLIFGAISSLNIYTREYKDYLELNDLDSNYLGPNNKGVINSFLSDLGNILSVAEDVAYTLLDPVQEIIKQNNLAICENPYRNMGASVRVGGPIGMQELLFREARFPLVKAAQEKMLGIDLEKEDVLEIGFSCSGGGWRAMCCSAGSCVGAKKIGLLDTAMSIAAVSGSAWFLGPWIYSAMDIDDYKKRVIEVAKRGATFGSPSEIGAIFDNIWVKLAFDQPLSAIDFYGSLNTNTLLYNLSKDPYRVYLSDQRKIIDNGEFPMPVYTAVLGEAEMDNFSFEFTPYEVGSRWLKSYVPTWAFGRHFKAGESRTFAPEQSMGFMIGIVSSAFAANFKEIYRLGIEGIKFPEILKNLPFAESIFNAVKKFIYNVASQTDLGDIRFVWARVPNYVYKLDGVNHNKFKELKLVDAGLEINNPVFANYRRPPYGSAPDIIFVFDSGTDLGFNELNLLANYAKNNGFKFPKIEKFEVGKSVIFVFKNDNDLDTPVIVYMPIVNGLSLLDKASYLNIDKYYRDLLTGLDVEKAFSIAAGGFAAIYNFKYTKKQAETLVACAEFNIISVQDKIKKIMKDRIALKRKFRSKNFK